VVKERRKVSRNSQFLGPWWTSEGWFVFPLHVRHGLSISVLLLKLRWSLSP